MSASEQHSEREPLLARQTEISPATTEPHSKKSWSIYVVILGIVSFLGILSFSVRNTMPAALTDEQAFAAGRFPGQHSYDEYLSTFTEPRPGNSKANRASRDWLIRTLREESNKHSVSVEIDEDGIPFIGDDSSSPFNVNGSSGSPWMIQSNNVLVKVIGTRGEDNAFLLSGHFDSVPSSHGVTDDGIAIAVMLEVYRNILMFPVEHTVIFNFNNYEEMGLWGSIGMLEHPWINDTRIFLNLEGAGAGGRALMFRATSPAGVAKAANANVLQHASVLGNDMFGLGLIKSMTDYSIYLDAGIPGVDLAFYSMRSHYHTTRDTLEYINPSAVQHMGDLALAMTRGLANADGIITGEQPKAEPFVYYDFLGQFALNYSMLTNQILNTVVLLGLPTYLAYWTAHQNTPFRGYAPVIKRSAIGFLLVTVTLVVVFAFSLFIGFLLTKLNPVALYGNMEVGALTILFAGIFGLIFSQWGFSLLDNKFGVYRAALDLELTTAYGLVILSWILLAFSTYVSHLGIGSLYFIFWLYAGTLMAIAIQERFAASRAQTWAVAFLLQVAVLYPLIFDIAFMTFDSMRHTLADGTPELAVYGLVAIFVTIMLICLIPWVHRAGYLKRATLASALILVFLMVITSSLFPYDSNSNPNKYIFNQKLNLTTGHSTISLASFSHVEDVVRGITTDEEWATRDVTIVRGTQTQVSFATKLLPMYFADPESAQKELQYSFKRLPSVGDKTQRVQATIHTQNSALCSVSIKDHNITSASLESLTIDHPIQKLTIFRQKFGEKYSLEFEYEADKPSTAILSCYYDEWINGRNPAFATVQEKIPDWAVLALRGFGLVEASIEVQL